MISRTWDTPCLHAVVLAKTQDWRILSRCLLLQRVIEQETCIELPLNNQSRVCDQEALKSDANEATGNEGVGVQNRMEGEEGQVWATSPFVDRLSIYLDWSVLRMDR
jgi:hypothetical protein